MKLFENFKLPDVEALKNTVEAIKDNLTPAEKAKESSKDKSKEAVKEEVPAGCIKCPSCGNILEKKALGRLKICPKCAKLFRLNSKDRVKTIADENSFVEFDINMEAKDPLNFPDYKTKIKSVQVLRMLSVPVSVQ
jgi:acetyl-CoA carboxylase beta subunit